MSLTYIHADISFANTRLLAVFFFVLFSVCLFVRLFVTSSLLRLPSVVSQWAGKDGEVPEGKKRRRLGGLEKWGKGGAP